MTSHSKPSVEIVRFLYELEGTPARDLCDPRRHPFWFNVGRKAELMEEGIAMPLWALGLLTSVLPSLFSAGLSALEHLIAGLDPSHPAQADLANASSSLTSAKTAVAAAAAKK